MSLRTLTLFLLLAVFAAGPAFGAGAAAVSPAEPATATSAAEADALKQVLEYNESLESMTAKERRALKREQRRAIKDAVREHKSAGRDGNSSVLLAVILTIIFPPLGMAVWDGGITNKFWISLLLTLLFYLPGLIYVLLQILG